MKKIVADLVGRMLEESWVLFAQVHKLKEKDRPPGMDALAKGYTEGVLRQLGDEGLFDKGRINKVLLEKYFKMVASKGYSQGFEDSPRPGILHVEAGELVHKYIEGMKA